MDLLPLIFNTRQEAIEAKRAIWRYIDEHEAIPLSTLYKMCGLEDLASSGAGYLIYSIGTSYVTQYKKGHKNGYELVLQTEPIKKGVLEL